MQLNCLPTIILTLTFQTFFLYVSALAEVKTLPLNGKKKYSDGVVVQSPSRLIALRFKDGELFLTRNFEGKDVKYWSSLGTGKPNYRLSKDAVLILQDDGNLVVYGLGNKPIWSSETANEGAKELAISDSGNMAIRIEEGKDLFSTETKGFGDEKLHKVSAKAFEHKGVVYKWRLKSKDIETGAEIASAVALVDPDTSAVLLLGVSILEAHDQAFPGDGVEIIGVIGITQYVIAPPGSKIYEDGIAHLKDAVGDPQKAETWLDPIHALPTVHKIASPLFKKLPPPAIN